ncbi:AT-hook motif nuclear-localized protein 1-like [Durio zibethinus]|uniref:AT-hook motif nuclear-localized protein n=1 Tax=Durio zibethinus TaxID=66656 RepID=A0A6P5ZMS6_DURZI|nr:AT-hook motif nuclear-localized protein 1-like [Durio zibethinus]
MEEKSATLSHDSVVNNGKKSMINTKNNSPKSQEVQATDDIGALRFGEGSSSIATRSENAIEKKRGRGRPRKYDNGVPNINGSLGTFVVPTASSSTKRAKGRPKGTGKWQALASIGGYMDTAGGSFTPHVLFVHTGEDLVRKITSFCLWASRSVFILAASGAVSSVTLFKPGPSTETSKYEGLFEILTLTGSYLVTGEMGTHPRNGPLSVSLARVDGRVFGGSVLGSLIAAGPGPIQVIVASFKQNVGRKIRKKYSAGTSTSANILASSELVDVPIQYIGMADGKENCTPSPAPVTVRADPVKADSAKSDNVVAENHNFNSASPESVGPNNMQKEDNVIAENHNLNPSSPQSVGPNNLQISPVSLPISDEMITPVSSANVPEMHVKD